MSLIEEALRRVQDPLTHTTTTPPTAPPKKQETTKEKDPAAIHSWPATPASTSAPAQPAPTTRALTALTISVFALTLVFVFGGFIWIRFSINRHETMLTNPPAPIKTGLPAPLAAHPATSTVISDTHPSAAQHSQTQNPVLSGVVEGLGEPYAVIDGMIVGVGEQVNGATLDEITNGTVTLRRSDGSVLTLSVRR